MILSENVKKYQEMLKEFDRLQAAGGEGKELNKILGEMDAFWEDLTFAEKGILNRIDRGGRNGGEIFAP